MSVKGIPTGESAGCRLLYGFQERKEKSLEHRNTDECCLLKINCLIGDDMVSPACTVMDNDRGSEL